MGFILCDAKISLLVRAGRALYTQMISWIKSILNEWWNIQSGSRKRCLKKWQDWLFVRFGMCLQKQGSLQWLYSLFCDTEPRGVPAPSTHPMVYYLLRTGGIIFQLSVTIVQARNMSSVGVVSPFNGILPEIIKNIWNIFVQMTYNSLERTPKEDTLQRILSSIVS